MRDMANGMLPVVPELDDLPDADEVVRLVGFARGLGELEARRLSGDAPDPNGPSPEEWEGMLREVRLEDER